MKREPIARNSWMLARGLTFLIGTLPVLLIASGNAGKMGKKGKKGRKGGSGLLGMIP